MSGTSSYNSDRMVTGEVEYPVSDPASGAFFQSDYKKNDDLKTMLDGSKDSLKLEAMKRIIGMIAKGRDASDLFPAVVKNVVSKNIEVKKLVYVYLVRYAEQQQDLALLSISTFQRALKDPNQLIRASALRVLSSIRVPMIVPIVMLAIRDSASDMSPYVRKTAAHAIPKLYSLDPEQKEELVSIIDKLLSDKAHLVVGSAAMAFSEVCPDRITLIHRSYRKLCALLADVDEWGQLALLNVLTVYARTCFADPNTDDYSSSETDKPFYEESDSEGSGAGGGAAGGGKKRAHSVTVDPDLRLLLRAAKPLLQSRNAGVVMAVAQLFYHTGPGGELPPVAKAMVRLLRAPAEVQSVVLNSIAALTTNKRSLFEPYLKSFFVRNSDPTHVKLLKLEILTNLATETSAAAVLREFQTYVAASDKAFVVATIQAIGRLAVSIETETDTCLNGLLKLLSSKDEWIVCEAVVVVKRVVGGGAASARAPLARASKLLREDRLAPAARAAALWLVRAHGAQHPRAAAILAHMLINFAQQDELVKLQVLSLAVTLSMTQPATLPMCRYAVALARYDASYDVRDRARLLRRFIEPEPGKLLAKYAAHIFCPEKPKPAVESSFKDRQQYTIGTLSQYIGSAAAGYRPLPEAPAAQVGGALRDTDTFRETVLDPQDNQKDKRFYSEPESSGSGSSSGSSSSDSTSEDSSDEEESNTDDKKPDKEKISNNYKSSASDSSEDSESDSDTSSGSESESSSASDHPPTRKGGGKKVDEKSSVQKEEQKNEKSNLELLLELDEVASGLPTMTPTLGGMLSPAAQPAGDDNIIPVGAALVPTSTCELVSRVSSGGLGVTRRWSRAPHLYSRSMCALTLDFTNHSTNELTGIRLNKKTLSGARAIHDFAPIASLLPGASAQATLGLDFADTIQPIDFTILSSLGEVTCSVTPPVGELVRAVLMSAQRFDSEQKSLRGMTECAKKAIRLEDEQLICRRVLETANLAAVTSSGELLRFSGRMMLSQDLVLVSVRVEPDCCLVTANCANMAVASLLANDVEKALSRP